MGIKNLRKLGNTADKIADGVTDINTVNNTLGPRYDDLLSRARALTGNDQIMLVDLTDSQINNGLLEGRGTAEDIAESKAVLVAWEAVITKVREVAITLPDVDE